STLLLRPHRVHHFLYSTLFRSFVDADPSQPSGTSSARDFGNYAGDLQRFLNDDREVVDRADLRIAGGTAHVYDVHSGQKVRLLGDRKSTRLNSSHVKSSYAVFC